MTHPHDDQVLEALRTIGLATAAHVCAQCGLGLYDVGRSLRRLERAKLVRHDRSQLPHMWAAEPRRVPLSELADLDWQAEA